MRHRRPRQRLQTVCVTKNSEYYLEEGRCIAVRDRDSGKWMRDHRALLKRLAGSLMYRDGDIVICSTPTAGDHLVFEGGCAVTSQIIDVWHTPTKMAS
jgi:hypothetical protein